MWRGAAHGVRLHEKGGKRHEMPCHHTLGEYLQVYIGDGKSTLNLGSFCSVRSQAHLGCAFCQRESSGDDESLRGVYPVPSRRTARSSESGTGRLIR
jgi:hypothetical protein